MIIRSQWSWLTSFEQCTTASMLPKGKHAFGRGCKIVTFPTYPGKTIYIEVGGTRKYSFQGAIWSITKSSKGFCHNFCLDPLHSLGAWNSFGWYMFRTCGLASLDESSAMKNYNSRQRIRYHVLLYFTWTILKEMKFVKSNHVIMICKMQQEWYLVNSLFLFFSGELYNSIYVLFGDTILQKYYMSWKLYN